MRKYILSCVLLALLFFVSIQAQAISPEAEYVEGEVLVKYKQEQEISKITDEYLLLEKNRIKNLDLTLLESKNKTTEQLLAELEGDESIEYVQPNYIYHVTAQSTPWGVSTDGVKADSAWTNNGVSGSGVVVAVIDTGVKYDHTDLDANMWDAPGDVCTVGGVSVACTNNGYDFANDDNNPADGHGHGTHVAGTIAAENNSDGVVGVAYNAEIMAIKVLSDGGSGTTADITEGIDFARINGANVINMSIGGYGFSTAENEAVSNAWDAGVVVVSAAGNESQILHSYPGAFEKSLSVAAIHQTATANNPNEDMSTRFVYFSNYAFADVAGPGYGVYSTYNTGSYSTMSGTSMASPHVAGVAALILEKNPTFTSAQVKQVLESTAVDLGATGRDKFFGSGLVDANAATTSLSNQIVLSANFIEDDASMSVAPTMYKSFMPADGSSTTPIRAYVTDSNGAFVTNAIVGFSTDKGSLSASSVVTDSSGIAEITLTADTSSGTATITADAGVYGTDTVEVEMSNVLLVTDSAEWYTQNNLSWFLVSMLEDLGVDYMRWDTSFGIDNDYPTADYLDKFDLVIWHTGDYYIPTAAQNIIATFLDSGGNILLTGPDQLYRVALGSTTDVIYTAYLKTVYGGDFPVSSAIVTGSDVLDGISLNLADPGYTDSGLYPDYFTVSTDGAEIATYASSESAGVKVDSTYNAVFLPFGIESIYYKTQREALYNALSAFYFPITNVAVSETTANTATITWDEYTASTVDTYNISYGTDADASNVGIETSETNSVILNSLTSGTTYYVKVSTTLSSDVTTNYSNILSFITEDGADTPTSLSVPTKKQKARTLRLKWVGYGDYYKVQFKKRSGARVKTFTNVTNSYKDVKKKYTKTNMAYKFRVKACVSSDVCSEYSDYKNTRTKPAKVKKLKVKDLTSSSFTLSWKKVRGKNIKYTVRLMDKNKKLIRKFRTTKKKVSITGLTSGQRYKLRVKAVHTKTKIYGKNSKIKKVTVM